MASRFARGAGLAAFGQGLAQAGQIIGSGITRAKERKEEEPFRQAQLRNLELGSQLSEQKIASGQMAISEKEKQIAQAEQEKKLREQFFEFLKNPTGEKILKEFVVEAHKKGEELKGQEGATVPATKTRPGQLPPLTTETVMGETTLPGSKPRPVEPEPTAPAPTAPVTQQPESIDEAKDPNERSKAARKMLDVLISDFPQLMGSDDPGTQNLINTLQEEAGGGKGSLGKSSVAAALRFTLDNPNIVEDVLATVDMMEKSGRYDNIELKAIRDFAGTDVRRAQDELVKMVTRPSTARRTEEEKQGIVVETAGKKAAATTFGKEGAEQSILKGTTIPGLKPLPNVRQTENSIKKVKSAKPKIEVLKREMDSLLNAYEKNGWKPIGPESANYESKVRIVQLLAKEADGGLFNLGVLNGPDLSILNEVIENPGSFQSGAKMARYGKDHIGKRLNNVKQLIDFKADEFYKTNGFSIDRAGQEQTKDVTPQKPENLTDAEWEELQELERKFGK